MNILIDAARQALEALKSCSTVTHWPAVLHTAEELRAAIEEAEKGQPDAWVSPAYFDKPMQQGFVVAPTQIASGLVPLYAHPPQPAEK